MTIRELKMLCIIGDEVCIYEEIAEVSYKDLYQGRLMDVPECFLERKVRVIGAQKENLVGIEVY